MSLPHSRNTTYNPSTPVESVDLNALQDCAVRDWDAIAGKDFVVYEDFLVGLGASGLVGVAGANANAPVADHASGGFGALSLPPNAGTHETLESMEFPLAGRPWSFGVRMRWKVQPTVVASYCMVGVSDTVGPSPFYFKVLGGAGQNWALKVAAGDLATTVVRSTGYRFFELRCDGTTIDALIDGVLYQSVTQPNGFKGRVHIDVFRDAGDGAAVELLVDAYKLWAAR